MLPLASVVINYLLSDVEFLKRDVTSIIFFGMLYIGVNFIVSKFLGYLVYPLLTWGDIRSFVTATIFILLLVGIYYILVILSALIPRRSGETTRVIEA